MSNWRIKTMSPTDTQRLGRVIGSRAQRGDVIALFGDLGAGKTQLVKGLAAGLGLNHQRVSSPTFVLVHEYEPEVETDPVLVHIDAYRLSGPDELQTIGAGDGFDEMRENSVVVIEWAERVASALGEDRLEIHLSHAGDDQRIVECIAYGDWIERMCRPITDDIATTNCPSCGTSAQPGSRDYPFCSKQCRMADLNKWFDESYRISRPIEEADLDEE